MRTCCQKQTGICNQYKTQHLLINQSCILTTHESMLQALDWLPGSWEDGISRCGCSSINLEMAGEMASPHAVLLQLWQTRVCEQVLPFHKHVWVPGRCFSGRGEGKLRLVLTLSLLSNSPPLGCIGHFAKHVSSSSFCVCHTDCDGYFFFCRFWLRIAK